jgi:hypothetical protein
MISRGELRGIAERKRLSLENAEKDYLLDLLLFQISTESGNSLVLKGGTCLYLLSSLNRFSEDLDFTLNRRRFDERAFAAKIRRRLSLVGIDGRAAEIERSGNEANLRFLFKGPLFDGGQKTLCRVVVNISMRERVMAEIRREMLIPSSREIPSFQVFAMSESEIAAEKVRAIMTRNKPRDVYDLWFLLKRGVVPDLSMIDGKLKIYKLKYSPAKFAASIDEKRKFWKTDLRGLIIGELVDFEKVRDEIIAEM